MPGPKKGWKKKAAEKAVQPAADSAGPPLSAADRENPERLSGEPLRKLAHTRGMARSDLDKMSDEKIRQQLRYIVARQYQEA